MTNQENSFMRWHIEQIYEQIPFILKASKLEYLQLLDWEKRLGKPILSEIELFTGEVSASAFQIIKSGTLTVDPEKVYQTLRSKSIFDIQAIVEWYRHSDGCTKTKTYVDTVNYWRLLIVEYLDTISR